MFWKRKKTTAELTPEFKPTTDVHLIPGSIIRTKSPFVNANDLEYMATWWEELCKHLPHMTRQPDADELIARIRYTKATFSIEEWAKEKNATIIKRDGLWFAYVVDRMTNIEYSGSGDTIADALARLKYNYYNDQRH